MKKIRSETFISRINDILATRITMLVGTIWAFYAFVIFGLTPIMWPGYEEQILYWSNFLQLVFLPIITVGTTIMSRGSEARAIEDHNHIRKEFVLLRDHDDRVARALQELGAGMHELLLRTAQTGGALLGHDDSSGGGSAPSPHSKVVKSAR